MVVFENNGCRFVKTNGENSDFIFMCQELDANSDDTVVGSGAYKVYDEETVEIKRVYIDKPYRGQGLGTDLLLHLEADAKKAGYRYSILETGFLLQEAYHLYLKSGYQIIPNYGQYKDIPESVCMKKML